MESIDLIKPMRSTLEDDSISSGPFLTADEISADLESLGWRECPLIRSIETLRSDAMSADKSPYPHRRGIEPADFAIVGKRPRSKRKRVSVNKLISALSSVSSSSFVVIDDDDDVEDSVPPPPLPTQLRISLPPPGFLGPPPGFLGPPPGFGDAVHWMRS